MRDLRVRFGFVLALAMLPLLVFSLWQSYYDYQRDSDARYAALVLAARQSVSGVINKLERADSVLRTVEQTLQQSDDCSKLLEEVANEFTGFQNLYVANAQGEYTCSTDQITERTRTFEGVQKITHADPTLLLRRETLSADKKAASTIRVAHGSFQGRDLLRVLITDISTRKLQFEDESLIVDAANIQLSILNADGYVLTGSEMQDIAIRKQWVMQALETGASRERYKANKLGARDLIILPTSNADVFIAFSQPYQSIWSWNLVNPLSSALVPVAAWFFGFIAIWLATDRLILIYLRRMRTSVVKFARGDTDQRVGDLGNPPASIKELGRTLDVMADRISSREADLADSVSEKDMLLREIHHRVKNNLQIIISLLNMQERKLSDPQGLVAIKDTRSRINAIALVHRGLYESDDLRYIPMGVFLDRLVGELGFALGTDEKGISLHAETECMPLEADTATPVALFVVEALTNAIKHGVPNGGYIQVQLTQFGETIKVSIEDSGKGYQAETTALGTGHKLIKGFARQLSGELESVSRPDGYTVTLTFTHRPYANNI